MLRISRLSSSADDGGARNSGKRPSVSTRDAAARTSFQVSRTGRTLRDQQACTISRLPAQIGSPCRWQRKSHRRSGPQRSRCVIDPELQCKLSFSACLPALHKFALRARRFFSIPQKRSAHKRHEVWCCAASPEQQQAQTNLWPPMVSLNRERFARTHLSK